MEAGVGQETLDNISRRQKLSYEIKIMEIRRVGVGHEPARRAARASVYFVTLSASNSELILIPHSVCGIHKLALNKILTRLRRELAATFWLYILRFSLPYIVLRLRKHKAKKIS
ncbi:hypothetical protein AVEN_8955-1 [Araneus ventricosus]|uniref:Uncharacterized protein n=1 Tax=Araneus ventricosus TaxID=182803 RepID=A0A4Y2LPK1_ARAVE|nr:hypothetical protein AVEN_8955-1 [Araneus ventricosus]